MFDRLDIYFKAFKRNGSERGYFPYPNKIILVAHPQNLKSGGGFRQYHGFKVCAGARYIGGYIGYDRNKGDWLKNCKKKWERDIRDLRKTANNYHHESYAAVVCAVQS